MKKNRIPFKKIVTVTLSVISALSLAGCSEQKANTNTTAKTATPAATQAVEEQSQQDNKSDDREDTTLSIDKNCCLLDVKDEKAQRMVLNQDVSLLDYWVAHEGEIEDDCGVYVQPQYYSWFQNCPNVKEIVIQNENNQKPVSQRGISGWYVENNLLMYKGKSQGVYACPLTATGNVVIPGKTKDIYDCAFNGCRQIESVTIPDTVRWVGKAAFAYNKKLKQIDVSKNNPYLKSVDGAFLTKDGRVLLAYPAGRKNKNYTVPKGVRYIEDGAFMGAENLEQIELPRGIYYIGEFVFKDCKNLKNIKSPYKVYGAAKSAYAYCDSLPDSKHPKMEKEEVVGFWENDYEKQSLSYLDDAYPWKFSLESYGPDNTKDIIEALTEYSFALTEEMPARLRKKIESIKCNYAINEMWGEAFGTEKFEEYEKKLDYFMKNYGE